MRVITTMAFGLFVLFAAGSGAADEFREHKPIRRPGAKEEPLLAGPAVPKSVVDEAVRDVAKAWNTPRMKDTLGSGLYDASRLGDAMAAEVPRDASLTVLAVENPRTLGHREETGPAGEQLVVSRVQVAVRTQVEFEHPTLGHQRLEGVNELVLDITRQAREAGPR